MGEPTRHDHRIDAAQISVVMPEDLGLATERRDRLDAVELAVGSGEEEDADSGGHVVSPPKPWTGSP